MRRVKTIIVFLCDWRMSWSYKISVAKLKKGCKNDPVYNFCAGTISPQIPQFLKRSIQVPLLAHTMSLVEIRQWSYFQNNSKIIPYHTLAARGLGVADRVIITILLAGAKSLRLYFVQLL